MNYFINKEKALKLDINHLAEADDFICDILKKARISDVTINECRVIFEEIFSHVCKVNKGLDKAAYLAVKRKFGQLEVHFAFEGERTVIDLEKRSMDNLSLTILSRYRDRLNFSYRRGTNVISISVVESSIRKGAFFAGAVLAAIIAGVILCKNLTDQQCVNLVDSYIAPAENLFCNALLLLSTPLVFLSMIRNITTVFSYSDNKFKIRSTIFRVLIMSAYTALGGIVAYGFIVNRIVGQDMLNQMFNPNDEFEYGWLADLARNFVPSNILELFTADTSVPLVLFAIVFAVAICCSGKYFNLLKTFFDAIYVIFSKMLAMLMVLLPLVLFFAILHDSLAYGMGISMKRLTVIVAFGAVGIVILILFLMIRIAVSGVNPLFVINKLKGAIPANLKINSTINAVPYNTRYCVKNIGMDVSRLEASLPIMAQINQAGNCFFLTFIPLAMLTWQGIEINTYVLIAVAALSIILSIGAPGQPGTIMIGMLVIMTLLNLDIIHYMFALVYVEVFYGWAMTFFNTFGDLSEITIAYLREQKKKQKKNNMNGK